MNEPVNTVHVWGKMIERLYQVLKNTVLTNMVGQCQNSIFLHLHVPEVLNAFPLRICKVILFGVYVLQCMKVFPSHCPYFRQKVIINTIC